MGGVRGCASGVRGQPKMTRRSLLHLGVPPTEVQRYTETARQELYAHWFSKGKEYRVLSQLRGAEQQFDLQWVRLVPDSPVAHKSIGESEIRKKICMCRRPNIFPASSWMWKISRSGRCHRLGYRAHGFRGLRPGRDPLIDPASRKRLKNPVVQGHRPGTPHRLRHAIPCHMLPG
jgi:hypothetical protein